MWNYKKIFKALCLLVLVIVLIVVGFIKYVIGPRVSFDKGGVINRATRKMILKEVENFDDNKTYNLRKHIAEYDFKYKVPFGKTEKFKLYVLKNYKFFEIERMDDGKIVLLGGEKAAKLYQNKKLLDLFKQQKKPVFTLKNQSLKQGEFTYIEAKDVEAKDNLRIKTDYFDAKFLKIGEKYIAMLPSSYETVAGVKNISCTYDTIFGAINSDFKLDIKPRDFKVQKLTIDKDKVKEKRTEDAREEHKKVLKKVFSLEQFEPKCDLTTFLDRFMLPIKGRLSTEYGVVRYVNNNLSPYNHSGTDIAVPKGRDVKATARGRIVFADELTLTGNTIVISHGLNIYSLYYHLDELLTNKGMIVEGGQIIGKVGTTGFSTGPHLHFEISCSDVRLESGMFIYGKPITTENYKKLFKNN